MFYVSLSAREQHPFREESYDVGKIKIAEDERYGSRL
jgi:hypothetical protein